MPVPQVDNNHVAEGTGLLTSRYANLKVTKGLTTALMLRFQELEGQLWSLINGVQLVNHPMPGGPWSILDQIGAIVGAARTGLTDAQYVQYIRIKARVNRSRGLSEDIIQLAGALAGPRTPGAATSGYYVYLDMPPAAFYLGIWDIGALWPTLPIVSSLLKQARGAGVYCEFTYSTWPDGNDFAWSSVYDSTAGQSGWGSVYDSSVGGLLLAGIGI